MIKQWLEWLEFLRDEKKYLEVRLRDADKSIGTMINICDHKYPDGTSALSRDSDGARCSICEKKV